VGEGAARLRPATAGDRALLERVYASTRAEELAQTQWSDEQKAQFCAAQFTAQDVYYREHYPTAQFSVIEHDGQPAGRLYVDRWENEIRVMDITVLPEHRGAGIGTKLLRDLQDEAAAAGKPLSIHVEKFNRALALYERLGFQVREDKGIYLLMDWRTAG
jgi:ribosomal protein S18 acetylase RimI-like enzyme